jgi:hypothetical protein
MADLKPIGSEKLTGQEKIKRIMEIARYNEAPPSNSKDISSTEYSIGLSDGNQYQIVKEKSGYIIKKTISESQTDYIEPMKNRKYFSSYSQALKRLNLMAKELNRLNENDEGISLFGEQKKFVLKTPKPAMDDVPAPAAPPAEPPPVPSPELPPSPESGDGDSEMPSDDMPIDDMPVDDEMGVESEPSGSEEEVTFKSIQKLTGKLTQKIREYESEKGLTSENIKYVINMVLSSLDLTNLSEEDKEDVLSKFESDEDMDMTDDDMGMEPSDDEDITGDSEVEDIQTDMDVPVESEMEEYSSIYDSIFGESKIDKVISNYFELTSSEKIKNEINENKRREKTFSEIRRHSESIEQELSSIKFLEENHSYKFVGKTNKSNLIFENKNGKRKITPEGLIL